MRAILRNAAISLLVLSITAGAPAGAAAPKTAPRKAPAAAAKPAPAPAKPALPVGKIVLPSLSYTIEKSGPATGAHPRRNDIVTVNYKVTLLDGKVLDSNEGKGPMTFQLGQLIPAWQILIQLMRPGDVWMLYVPSEYAYGPMARDELPANAFLTFRVELLSIGAPETAPIAQEQ
jgi:FKBP-type peptidyl-prolyl cis-trans isomerase